VKDQPLAPPSNRVPLYAPEDGDGADLVAALRQLAAELAADLIFRQRSLQELIRDLPKIERRRKETA